MAKLIYLFLFVLLVDVFGNDLSVLNLPSKFSEGSGSSESISKESIEQPYNYLKNHDMDTKKIFLYGGQYWHLWTKEPCDERA